MFHINSHWIKYRNRCFEYCTQRCLVFPMLYIGNLDTEQEVLNSPLGTQYLSLWHCGLKFLVTNSHTGPDPEAITSEFYFRDSQSPSYFPSQYIWHWWFFVFLLTSAPLFLWLFWMKIKRFKNQVRLYLWLGYIFVLTCYRMQPFSHYRSLTMPVFR